MQWLARVCVERPVFAMMLIAAMVVAGAASYLQLGVDRFPRMDLPSVYVRTTLPRSGPSGNRNRDHAASRRRGRHGGRNRRVAVRLE